MTRSRRREPPQPAPDRRGEPRGLARPGPAPSRLSEPYPGPSQAAGGPAPAAARQWECARFVADRKLPLGKLLTHRFRLGEAAAAYRVFDTQTAGKGVFVPDW